MSEKKLIRDQLGKILACGLQLPGKALLTEYGCGLVIATTTGSCFGYLKLIKRPTRIKFGMRLPSNWVSITNHMYVCVNGLCLLLCPVLPFTTIICIISLFIKNASLGALFIWKGSSRCRNHLYIVRHD